ncbi:hypothetical protein ACA910_022241 [Epithemia clementina (nom. ined.)]
MSSSPPLESSSRKVIIFGSTGAIGTELAEVLSTQYPEWQIQAVTRDTSKKSRLASMQLANVTIVQGDPFDATAVAELSRDCDIVFCCIGFQKYEFKYWSKHWPIVVNNLLNSINKANAESRPQGPQRLVFCDNIYAYGAGHDNPITTSTPMVEPSLKKGKPNVRSWMRKQFEKHMKDHPGTLTVVGGADFFGPHVTNASFLGDTMTGKIVKGEAALAIGAIHPIHDFCYAPDFARALATVAVQDKAYDHFWICPHAIHNKSLQEIADDIADKVHTEEGEDMKKRTKSYPISLLDKCLLYLISPFMSFAWEMIEMSEFWTKDYQIDDSEFCKTFGVKATDYDEALQALVDFYENQKLNREAIHEHENY